MKYILSFIFLLTIQLHSLQAQQPFTPPTFIYKISAAEAKEIYQSNDIKNFEYEKRFLHTFVDSFFTKKYPKEDALNGYYIYVNVENNYNSNVYLSSKIQPFHNVFIRSMRSDQQGYLQILDTAQQTISDVQLYFKKKPLAYNDTYSAYELPKKAKQGFVTIIAASDTILYQLRRSKYNNYYGYGRDGSGWFSRWRDNRRTKKRRGYIWKNTKGYIVINQPKFRPLDTMKVKAFIGNRKGKPLNEPVKVAIYDEKGLNYFRKRLKPITTQILQPNADGNYTANFVLGDSLKIDQMYHVYFMKIDDKKYRTLYFSETFELEDYELDKVTFNLTATQKKYEPKDKIILNASGKDANGSFIPDGTLRLTVLNAQVLDFYEHKIYIPDTIWQYSTDLKTNGLTKIVLPMDKIPPVRIKLHAKGEFFNSNGEYQTKDIYFEVNNYKNVIDVQLKDHLITAQYDISGKSQDTTATLITYVYNTNNRYWQVGNQKIVERTIQLPFSEPINPFVSKYEFRVGETIKVFGVTENAQIQASGINELDSIHIQLNNPRQLPIVYAIYKGKEKLLEGKTSETSWKFATQSEQSPFTLLYQYPWRNTFQTREEHFAYSKDQLHISIEQAPQVLPGASLPVKIQIKDQNGQPVSAANVTALAVNSTFEASIPFGIKDNNRDHKSKKVKFRKYGYNLSEINKGRILPLNNKWYKRMQLDKDLFYRLRFPKEGMLFEYIDTKDKALKNTAQFAVFLTKNGQIQPISLIYLNEKLKYYIGANESKPYSFTGVEGKNTITIRAFDREYKIQDVELKKGKKLILSLDVNHYINHPHSKKVEQRSMPEKLTYAEKALLDQTMLFIQPKSNRPMYFWQSSNDVHRILGSTYRSFMIGPFEREAMINMVVQDEYQKDFLFESGFRYEVEEQRERLYELKNQHKTYSLYSFKGNLSDFSSNVRTIKDVEPYSDFRKKLLRKQSFSQNKASAKYKLGGVLNAIDVVVFWMKNDSLVNITGRNYNRIYNQQAGDYTLLFYIGDSTYIQRNITLKANHLYYENPSEKELFESVKIDKNLVQFKRILQRFVYKNQRLPEEELNMSSFIKTDTILYHLSKGDLYKKLLTGQIEGQELLASVVSGVAVSERKIRIRGIAAGVTRAKKSYSKTSSFDYSRSENGGFEQAKQESDQLSSYDDSLLEYGILNKSNNWKSDEDNSNTEAYLVGEYEQNKPTIRSKFQDNAYWKPNLMTDQNGEVKFTAHFPDNITTWKTMVIGMDQTTRNGTAYANTSASKPVMGQLAIPRFLVEGDEVTIIGKAINLTNDSFQVNTQFKQNGELIVAKQQQLSNSIIEKATIQAGDPTDSLKLLYQLVGENISDGEERVIPIVKKGVIETVGQFWLLEGDTSFVFEKKDNYGDIKVSVQSSALDVLIEDLERLKVYPYHCNEQTASRLIALLLEKEVKNHLDQPFKSQVAINRAIKKLYNTQNSDGSWGWWKDGKANGWITAYVLKALYQSEQAGEISRSDKFTNGVRFLVNNYQTFSASTRLFIMDVMVMMDLKSDFDVKIEAFLKEQPTVSLHQQMILIKARQSMGSGSDLLNNLTKQMKRTTFGGFYWGSDGYRWFDNSIHLTITAYDIYKKAGREDICKGIRRYFLEKRTHQGWRNTFESAQILNIMLPEILKNKAQLSDNSISINGKTINAKQSNFQATYTGQQISIKKTGNDPVYITAFQQFHNPAPTPKSDIFEVNTSLIQKGKTSQSKQIARNQPVTMKVNVNVKQSADYVMIEIPIPAGCSYENKTKREIYQEVHREYFKDKVAIFCEQLPVGQYTFNLQLEPRYKGDFTINAAKTEQMYFPVFYGRNENKVVKIE